MCLMLFYIIDSDRLLDGLKVRFCGGLFDRFGFGKIDENITSLIDNELDVLKDLILDLEQDGVDGMSPGFPPLRLRN